MNADSKAARSKRWLRAVLLASAVMLCGGGGAAIGWAGTHQTDAPQPTPDAAGYIGPRPPAPPHGSGPAPATTPTTLPRSLPTQIVIPAIGVHSELQYLGENPDGTLRVPQPGPRYNEAAWYTGSPTPGQLGPSVIEGHVDSAADGPSVFFRLGALHPGDLIYISERDDQTAAFTVNAVRSYPKAAFPTATVYANTDDAELRVLTCGGAFDRSSGRYLSNIVVFARLTNNIDLPSGA